jgi:hypothetical protein
MKLIYSDIKLYKASIYFALGIDSKIGYVINTTNKKNKNRDHVGYLLSCRDISNEETTITIDNKKLFLTKDNLLFFRGVSRALDNDNKFNIVVDLKTRELYEYTDAETSLLKSNLSDRKTITMKNS